MGKLLMFKMKHVYSRVSDGCGSTPYGGFGSPSLRHIPRQVPRRGTALNEVKETSEIEKLKEKLKKANLDKDLAIEKLLKLNNNDTQKEMQLSLNKIGCFVKKF
jgi:hypothetical protein